MATKSEIARSLSVSKSAVSRWSRRGMPCHDVSAALAWHGSHIRTRRRRKETRPDAVASTVASPPADPPIRSWRDRLDAANAAVRELEVARLKGELLPAAEVRYCRERQTAAFRARMLAIPGRIAAQWPEDKAQALAEVLTAAIHEALAELSGTADEAA